jgi:hypothetical protein
MEAKGGRNRSRIYGNLLQAIRKAATAYAPMKEPLDEILFPFWRDAAHEIMKLEGCPCTLNDNSDDEACFMDADRKTQIDLFNDMELFSYQGFIEILQKGKKRALDG